MSKFRLNDMSQLDAIVEDNFRSAQNKYCVKSYRVLNYY